MPGVVEIVLKKLVGDEVEDLEGNIHAQLSGVAAVEGLDPLQVVDSSDAVESPPIRCVVHLESLLYNCVTREGGREEEGGGRRREEERTKGKKGGEGKW